LRQVIDHYKSILDALILLIDRFDEGEENGKEQEYSQKELN
jgi:hypothetical protein